MNLLQGYWINKIDIPVNINPEQQWSPNLDNSAWMCLTLTNVDRKAKQLCES